MHYKEIINRDSLCDFEIYLLGLVMEYSQADREVILNKLIYLFQNNKVLTGGNRLYNSQVYFWVIKNLGRENKYREVIEFADGAIKYSKNEFSFYSLNFFHYYKALAHYRLGELDEYIDEIYNAIIICLYQSSEKRNKFFTTVLKDTGINANEFILSKLASMSEK